jgi:polysaccharide export outer membrane protein
MQKAPNLQKAEGLRLKAEGKETCSKLNIESSQKAQGLRLKAEGKEPCSKLNVESSRLKIQGSMYKAILFCFVTLLFFSSCTTVKNTTYFQGIKNDTTLTNLVSKDFEPKIQKGDLLSITVASLSPENTAIYNAPQNIEGTATGYLVDKNGNINFFKLDTLHVEGMTRKELKEALEKDLTPYLAQTVVAVGFLNRHVTMIGALSQVLPMPNDHMTILDALATGGDIGERGMTNDVLVIREKDNGKEFKKLDLTDESIFHSPYFYLQPNDIIYIKPVKKKTENTTRIISYVTAGITFVFFIIDRFTK